MVTVWIRTADFNSFQAGQEIDCSLTKYGRFEVKIEVPINKVRGFGTDKKVKL